MLGEKKDCKGMKKGRKLHIKKHIHPWLMVYLSIYPSILLNVFYTHCTIYNNQRMIKMLDGYFKSRKVFQCY